MFLPNDLWSIVNAYVNPREQLNIMGWAHGLVRLPVNQMLIGVRISCPVWTLVETVWARYVNQAQAIRAASIGHNCAPGLGSPRYLHGYRAGPKCPCRVCQTRKACVAVRHGVCDVPLCMWPPKKQKSTCKFHMYCIRLNNLAS
jgi:hypothetical protein